MNPAAAPRSTGQLEQAIKDEASRLGLVLAGFTSVDPPPHLTAFEEWLANGRHGDMAYMARDDTRSKRADPRRLMPECRTILVLATPYWKPIPRERSPLSEIHPRGRVAAYAWGEDYHRVLPGRLKQIVRFIEASAGRPVRSRCYTDTGPVLEKELAQRAGLGWIGKNTCLINPRKGSYFLLSEIFLDLELESDVAVTTDHCGTCRRCIDACPTDCILPNRTIDATRCISYLTIESRGPIPPTLRDRVGDWVFGCDICQIACPWNRFAAERGDGAFAPAGNSADPGLFEELDLSQAAFANRYQHRAVERPGWRGFRRNVAVAVGNSAQVNALPVLNAARRDADPLVRDHLDWAIERISTRQGNHDKGADRHE